MLVGPRRAAPGARGGVWRTKSRRARPVLARAAAADGDDGRACSLASSFARHVAERGLDACVTAAKPSALLPPDAVVRGVLEALQRVDFPSAGAGFRTAFAFAWPRDVDLLPVGAGAAFASRERRLGARWLDERGYASAFASEPLATLVGATGWEPAAPVRFLADLDTLATLTVRVAPEAAPPGAAPCELFTFRLRRVDTGSYRGCWLTTDVVPGDDCDGGA